MCEVIRPLAVVTGAASGIGFELARRCADHGYDLLIAADEPQIDDAADKLRRSGASVEALEVDFGTKHGVERLYAAVGGRPVAALLTTAGRGFGYSFLDRSIDDLERLVASNVTGTLYLIHKIARDMRRLGRGRILVAGPLLDSFAVTLRAELDDSGVSVTSLTPGATGVEFFERPNHAAFGPTFGMSSLRLRNMS